MQEAVQKLYRQLQRQMIALIVTLIGVAWFLCKIFPRSVFLTKIWAISAILVDGKSSHAVDIIFYIIVSSTTVAIGIAWWRISEYGYDTMTRIIKVIKKYD